MLLLVLLLGGIGTLAVLFMALRGPSPAKAAKRRLELLKERHAEGIAASAQARCQAAGTGSPEVARLCRTRQEDISVQKASVAAEQEAVAQACAKDGNGKGEP